MIQAALVSLMTLALFLDIVSNRKQVWLVIGIAAGLAYIARHRTQHTPDLAALTAEAGSEGSPRLPRPAAARSPIRALIRRL
jgi:hypothetical protein